MASSEQPVTSERAMGQTYLLPLYLISRHVSYCKLDVSTSYVGCPTTIRAPSPCRILLTQPVLVTQYHYLPRLQDFGDSPDALNAVGGNPRRRYRWYTTTHTLTYRTRYSRDLPFAKWPLKRGVGHFCINDDAAFAGARAKTRLTYIPVARN